VNRIPAFLVAALMLGLLLPFPVIQMASGEGEENINLYLYALGGDGYMHTLPSGENGDAVSVVIDSGADFNFALTDDQNQSMRSVYACFSSGSHSAPKASSTKV